MDDYQPQHRADVPVDYVRVSATRRRSLPKHSADQTTRPELIRSPAPHPLDGWAPTRLLTSAEVTAMRDPGYQRRMLADAHAGQLVEVDNPFRTELRPRRGTE